MKFQFIVDKWRSLSRFVTKSWSVNKFKVRIHDAVDMNLITEKIFYLRPDLPTISRYLGDMWKEVSRTSVNGNRLEIGWEYYRPRAGDIIDLYPAVGVKALSNAFIQRLNAVSGTGRILKAIILVENPVGPVTKYYVDNDEDIIFDGNTYKAMPMRWSGVEMNASMSLPSMAVTVQNIGGEVMDYVETLNILDQDVTLRLIHSDLLNDPTAKDDVVMQIQSIEGDDIFVTFHLGLNLGLTDLLPRDVMTRNEFPGLVDDAVRFTV
jgi:hypothetical protein